jgi:hypothetical protein
MNKIFLVPEVASGLGEDTFWTWAQREMGGILENPKKLEKGDIVLHYSTMGTPIHPEQTIALLWELYPEMSLRLGTTYLRRNLKLRRSFSARWATCPTHYSRAFYSKDTVVLPIGVNTELFKPAEDKALVRRELGLDVDSKYVLWAHQNHVMKGPDLRDDWLDKNPDWKVIKFEREKPISQELLAKYMQAADASLNTSRLVPLYMVDWEALAAGLPFIEGGGVQRELPREFKPREFVFNAGWSRVDARDQWLQYIDKCRFELSKD